MLRGVSTMPAVKVSAVSGLSARLPPTSALQKLEVQSAIRPYCAAVTPVLAHWARKPWARCPRSYR
jgi:hypothetical protein